MKRRNHEVPKGILKNWLGSEADHEGAHYIDLSSGVLKFEKGKEAAFAITDYLYVPQRPNGERDDALEDWFSIDENGLALFALSAATGALKSFTDQKMINQAIRACIALGSRSAYGMYMATSVMEPTTGSRHEAAVANVLNSIGHKFKKFSTWEFLVIYDLPAPLLISERPFADFTTRNVDMVAMPLAPRALLLGMPPDQANRSTMSLRVGPAGPQHHRVVKMYNDASVEMARQWIVGGTRSELEVLQAELTPEKVLARRRTDRAFIERVLR
ncbi:hypothetical protein [Acetobacter sp. DsW_54]|uniref:hypothetical protein n=1 Tax=Acetobacter sp. DsW_54 TaxID=1670660 RepID=UPI0011775F7F|nr:hypothetical protein [Acetobacter sp. DsW_54]